MFDDILVATDRHDTAEEAVRHRMARERRFLGRLRAVALELVVPTDGPGVGPGTGEADVEVHTEHATRHAIDLARTHGARLHVLFFVDVVRYDTTVSFATEPLVEEGEAAVDEVVDAAEREGLETTGTVEVGRPAAVVLDSAAANDVDLVVLNARGRAGRWPRLRRGLVASVIDGASAPVYVVPGLQPGHPD